MVLAHQFIVILDNWRPMSDEDTVFQVVLLAIKVYKGVLRKAT